MPCKKHVCELKLGFNNMASKSHKFGLWERVCHNLKKLTIISEYHPRTSRFYRSYPAIVAEREKHLYERDSYLIHPYSLFSLDWNSFMVLIHIAHMFLSPLRLCFVFNPPDESSVHVFDMMLLPLHLISLLDIFIKFNTGCKEIISMDRQTIANNYIRRYFLVDLISSIPLAFILLQTNATKRFLLMSHVLPLVKISRVYKVVTDLRLFMKLFIRSCIIHRSVRQLTLYVLVMHWFTCCFYLAPTIAYYWHGNMQPGYVSFLKIADGDLTKIEIINRYKTAMFLTLAAFFGISFSMFKVTREDEILIHAIIFFCASMFMVYTLVFLLKIYMTMYNSSVRYHELMNQVEEYMRHKQFPKQLRKRVLTFYNYRYQEQYFKEGTAMKCLSEQLRHEINLHTCHKLITKVPLFEGLPASLVGTVLGCLKPEVYLANDLVVRAGETGECMYFIAHGTVAVYSLKGAEVCHLEDGAHFGEVALLMKDNKRVASMIAIETTQVYRLDVNDFRNYIIKHQDLYKRLETLAAKRMNETVLMDEQFRREREKHNEQKQSKFDQEISKEIV